MDRVTPAIRTKIMSSVRTKNTGPEMVVRKLVHALGYRYRLHKNDLPGRPDLVFSKRKKIIFVHGCFWHGHEGCSKANLPKSRLDYWKPKLEANRQRDQKNLAELNRLGWSTLVVWQCELKEIEKLKERIVHFLEM